jgi:hypothetical protein
MIHYQQNAKNSNNDGIPGEDVSIEDLRLSLRRYR